MYTGQMLFSQLMDFLPRHEFNQFNQCVRRYQCTAPDFLDR